MFLKKEKENKVFQNKQCFFFSGKKQLSLLDNLMIYSNISQHFFSPGHSIGYTYKSNYKLCLTSSGDSCQSPWLSPTQECGFPTLSCPLLTQCKSHRNTGVDKSRLTIVCIEEDINK